jgi:pterin-4a-carbinolamine dehydratase
MSNADQGRLIGNLIFLSYRRADTATSTLALRLELQTQLRAAQIFVDTHTIQSGDAWPHQIDDALRVAKVIIPVIGKSWAGGDEVGKRRIDDPKDWVHKELAMALAQKRSAVMPVLVDGARRLRRADLPEPLQDLADIQPLKIDLDQWDHDLQSLIQVLNERGFEAKTRNFKYPEPDPLKWKTMAVPWDVLETEVAQRLPNWRIEISDDIDNLHYKRVELVRDFDFESFEKAMEFMQVVAKHAGEIDHHPRWMNLWRTVTVWLSTWDAGRRVTALDVQLAQYLERKYKEFK